MINLKHFPTAPEQWSSDEDERGSQVVAVMAFFTALMILIIVAIFALFLIKPL